MENYQTGQMADFIHSVSYGHLDQTIVYQLKKHLLDSLGSLIQAQSSPTIKKFSRYVTSLGTDGNCSVPMLGNLPVDRAAEWFTALIRYPDFMDNFLGKEATCHPSDNIGPLLATGQLNNISGKDFLLAMAIGYAIECRLIEELPVMKNGFDHTTLYAYSVTGAMSKILKLTTLQTAHALGMAGVSFVPLVTSRAFYTYEFKGLASSIVALGCTNMVLMARENLTGPISIFEGPRGFEQVLGMKLKHQWSSADFNLIRKCVLKSFNAEVHTQSSLETALELKAEFKIDPAQIESIDITTFLTAYHIVGGGVYGDRKFVHSKEQADHSLPYTVAVIMLDGQLYPEQLTDERINRPDVQALLKKVKVDTVSPVHKPLPFAGILDPYTDAYPDKLKTKMVIKMITGEKFSKEKTDYHGFFTRPFSWQDTTTKFKKLTGEYISALTQEEICNTVHDFEKYSLRDLISLIAAPVKKITKSRKNERKQPKAFSK
jgi:2-methylcitrate dehydratase